jgi:hypothetical protein
MHIDKQHFEKYVKQKRKITAKYRVTKEYINIPIRVGIHLRTGLCAACTCIAWELFPPFPLDSKNVSSVEFGIIKEVPMTQE